MQSQGVNNPRLLHLMKIHCHLAFGHGEECLKLEKIVYNMLECPHSATKTNGGFVISCFTNLALVECVHCILALE